MIIYNDSRWRDTLGSVHLQHQLQNRGIRATIVPYDHVDKWLHLIAGESVILNHPMGRRNQAIIEFTKANGGNVYVLHTEGRPNTDEQLEWYKKHFENDGVDWFFVWCDEVATLTEKTNVTKTGNPRFFVYGDNTRIPKWQAEKIKARHGFRSQNIITVATAFPSANASTQWFTQDWRDLGIDADAKEAIQTATKAKQDFVVELFQICQWARDNDYEVCLRPHPMESPLEWEALSQEWGFRIVTQEYIHNLLMITTKLINTKGCTTTNEAWLAGVPVYSLGEHLPPGLAQENDSIRHHYDSLHQFLESKKRPPLSPAQSQWLTRMNLNNDTAAEEIANQIAQLEDSFEPRNRLEILRTIAQNVPHSINPRLAKPGKAITPFSLKQTMEDYYA